MEFEIKTVREIINKAFLRIKPSREEIENFRKSLNIMLGRANEQESEEHHKNELQRFFEDAYYRGRFYINTKGHTDLVLHNGAGKDSSTGVLLECKRPGNKAEFPTKLSTGTNLNCKALHELLYYYLQERLEQHNLQLRHLMISNNYECYIIDAVDFERVFGSDKKLQTAFTEHRSGSLLSRTTDDFYQQIARPFIENSVETLPLCYVDLREYRPILAQTRHSQENQLIALYKLFSPEHLLKLPFQNDSNTLDRGFYQELLYIMGLEERQEKGRKLIGRCSSKTRQAASLLENTIKVLDSENCLADIQDIRRYGAEKEERLYHVALELVLCWINRILFLKLLEGQQLQYHKGDEQYRFLRYQGEGALRSFDDLNRLFFQVLAVQVAERGEAEQQLYDQLYIRVPYLNSSLFERTALESETIRISNLETALPLPLSQSTVLKTAGGKVLRGLYTSLEYLLRFLDAYDFASEGAEEIQEQRKTLINASVLGLIFEKINGYAEGSFFTPGFITMYMCRETLRRAVLQKFRETKGWDCENLKELYNRIEDSHEANRIVNSLRICDPAVGSGHFLVSALNELIVIKSELGILQGRDGKRLKYIQVEVANDELVILDEEGELFEYQPRNPESQRVQEALFHEKQALLEGCLYGVDINQNSVAICQLRLWIELLKHAYYKRGSDELETLPNIDINIQVGNSLISRYTLDSELGPQLTRLGWSLEEYRTAIRRYQHAENKEDKKKLFQLIADFRKELGQSIEEDNPKLRELRRLQGKSQQLQSRELIAKDDAATARLQKEEKELERKIAALRELDAEPQGEMFRNALEWRVQFPEVLDNDGHFVGFDVVIGNPPYIQLQSMKGALNLLQDSYSTFAKTGDIYCLFYELGARLAKDKGFVCLITSNKWMRSKYGKRLRSFLTSKVTPQLLVDLGKNIFDEAMVDCNILGLCKQVPQKIAIEAYEIGERQKYTFTLQKPVTIKTDGDEVWTLLRPLEQSIKSKVEAVGSPLKDWDVEINYGIKTGYNQAFVIDKAKRDELIAQDAKSAELIHPMLRGRDVGRYWAEFAGKYLINTHNGIKDKHTARIDVVKDYPAIKKYLDNFYPALEQRQDKGDSPYNLRNCAYIDKFKKEKLVWGEITTKPRFYYDDEKYYPEATTFIMTGERLKFLLGLLSSKLIFFAFKTYFSGSIFGAKEEKGERVRFKKDYINALPIKVPTKKEEKAITQLVEQILKAKKANAQADTGDWEAEIDQLVYTMYGLSEKEVELVEGV